MLKLKPLFIFAILFVTHFSYSQKLDTIKIYFDIDKHDITQEHIVILDDLLQNKDARDIEIYGFTDFLGNHEYNKTLSEKRCSNIKDYLITKGVEQNKISTWSGKGVHKESYIENRKDINDPGIKEHRKVEIIYGRVIKPKETPVVVEKKEEPVVIPVYSNFSQEDIVVGKKIVLENILFYGGTPEFKPESTPALNNLVLVMRNNPNLKIEIQGHICCEKANKDGWDDVYKDHNLSSNRARAVYHHLISKGIDENRMTFKGFGASRKLYPRERDEEERGKNRRVEILILEN